MYSETSHIIFYLTENKQGKNYANCLFQSLDKSESEEEQFRAPKFKFSKYKSVLLCLPNDWFLASNVYTLKSSQQYPSKLVRRYIEVLCKSLRSYKRMLKCFTKSIT